MHVKILAYKAHVQLDNAAHNITVLIVYIIICNFNFLFIKVSKYS